ncbi:sodium-independent sulfate anion transporter [Polistes fuscatus]|uniref:sodium-independent sulfate anion transporter n=1 Tax=Polistes fuscatus TaxID=30207 RepID=UPI001CA9E166|nr:sodium-independent sulfate anion transporter [Polistes fuscatus]XP_043502994.1 sodium-independent sulfate anion transporter [Polistes fuscatus]XP_043502995.1 sodium-independent sulfate anion transporter [Polistes fuscatus]XP_043502996.1 sodium-independent sulfate anion transporter [Polistes fuscatus]XP_043502997.1 sodium-independent sulfate anion transporter [Polistes fuscatus]
MEENTVEVQRKFKTRSCSRYFRKFVKRRIPILEWLPKYNSEKFFNDAIAGVTVGLTVMPQGLAYATLAGLEPQYGLYSAFIGAMVYVIFGSCKDITIGPTALMALMTHEYVQGRSPDFAVLLAFLTGCLQLLMACLHLGVLIDFISVPVTVGFTSATSVIIVASQLKGLLGLRITSVGFLDTLIKVFQNIYQISPWDTVMSFTCIIILLSFRKMKDIKLCSDQKKASTCQRILTKTIWMLSTARNAIIVIICSVIAYNLNTSESNNPFILTGKVRSGLPSFGPPPFSTHVNNRTIGFMEMCSELGTSILLVPIIGVLGNVAIAKAFANGGKIDATQELLTLGICNLLGSCASAMPVTGSFSRSAVNHASGVKTPMGGLYTGVLILLALSLLTPYFYFIPKASLAAVIICAVIYMIEYEVVKLMWKSSKKDLIPMFVTFLFCLIIGVEYGILLGVGTNLIFLLYPSARPTVHVDKCTTDSGAEYLLITPGNSLYFPAVDFIKQSVGDAGVKEGSSQLPVVVDCRYVLGADFTAAKGIATLIGEFNNRKQSLYFFNPRSDVVAVLKGACGEEFQYVSTQEELSYLLSTSQDKSSRQLLELSKDKNNEPLLLNNLGVVHRNNRSSTHELSEVTTTLLHATAS